MLKRENYGLFLIVFGSIALNLFNCPNAEIFFDDKELWKYAGLVIYRGGAPYLDMFDHKPPLIYFLYSVNWYFSPWITWILDSLLVVLATVLFYGLCKKNKLAWPWFLPLIFNLMIRYSLVSFGNGMTREYTAVFLLIFFCVMNSVSRYRYVLMGMLVGLTCWMQQDGLLTLIPFLIYSLYQASWGSRTEIWKKILKMSAGFAIISIPLLFYFFYHHAISLLWKDAVLINLHVPGKQPGMMAKFKAIKHALHEVEFEMAFYTALILGICSLFLNHKKPALLRVAILTLFLSFSAEFISGRLSPGNSFVYYLLPLSASIPILVWVVFTETQVSFLKDKTAQLIFYLMLSVTLFLGTLRFTSGVRFTETKTEVLTNIPEKEYLKSQHLSDYQLYVLDDSKLVYLYNYFEILAPSPWLYHSFWEWSKDWDADNKIFLSIINDLQLHKTRFILDCSGTRNNIRIRPIYAQWQQFLHTNYILISKDSSNRELWKIQ